MAFTEDAKIQQIAEAYAADAIDFARNNFHISLDGSDASVYCIEGMLGVCHAEMAEAQPSEERIFEYAKMFGSYVGEVFRRHHGATWGLANVPTAPFAALRSHGQAGYFWPWGRAHKRLVNGPEDNMWHYYQALLERDRGVFPKPVPIQKMPNKKSWWARLRGV